jgi:hypothetical protein
MYPYIIADFCDFVKGFFEKSLKKGEKDLYRSA